MSDIEERFLRWRDGRPPLDARPPSMSLDGLPALMAHAGLRIRSGRIDCGLLVLDMEADRVGGGAVDLSDLDRALPWATRWTWGGMGVRRGTASLACDSWTLHVDVAEDTE